VAPLGFALTPQVRPEDLEAAQLQSLGFVQQLDWIGVDPDFMRQCYIHFTQARATRIAWTDTEEISEASLQAYEDELLFRWSVIVRREAQSRFDSETDRGQTRLNDTLSEDSTIDGQVLPRAITCGNFHFLANFTETSSPKIGWHPDFLRLAKKNST
jgi:hypothetical protein